MRNDYDGNSYDVRDRVGSARPKQTGIKRNSVVLLDENAFYALLADKTDNLRRFVAARLPSLLQDVVSAEDIMQAVWAKAFQQRSSFAPHSTGTVDAWLLKIARNEIADTWRQHMTTKRGGGRKRFDLIDTSLTNVFRTLVSPGKTPSSELSFQEQREAVRLAIASLPHREIVWAREIEGIPMEEIASRFGKTERALAGILRRARLQLRDRLGQFVELRNKSAS